MINRADGTVLVKVLDNGHGEMSIRDYTGEQFLVIPEDNDVKIQNVSDGAAG